MSAFKHSDVVAGRQRPPRPAIVAVVLTGLIAVSFVVTAVSGLVGGDPLGLIALVGAAGAVAVAFGLWRGNRFAFMVAVAYAATGVLYTITDAYLLNPGRSALEFGANVALLLLLLAPPRTRGYFVRH